MDIVDFVKAYIPAQDAGKQFAVLAFDMNLQAHSTAHPPPEQMADFSFDPNRNSDSGPWCAAVVNFSKSPGLKAVLGEEGGNLFKNPGHIHPEDLLMKLLDHYILRYYARYNHGPSSVALYSYNSPCENCNSCLRYRPGNHYQVRFEEWITIPNWVLRFSEAYCEPHVNPNGLKEREEELYQKQFNGDEKARAGRYLTEETALRRANALRGGGWYVYQIEG
ncbi:hypothetical protein [Undibacterium sp.]|uniref:hypothetical protein n=1 Tax=Undibacterium sp. TaxID=1914977 RepID=UPI00374CFEBD